jgi:predicted enzyme related to lactoylglutathione lyase
MVNSQGRFVWYELMTSDVEAAKAFYSGVVGWGAKDASMPGMAYTLFTAGNASVSGLVGLPGDARKMGARPSWIGYVGVNDVDAAADRIRHLGGAIYVPPKDIANISRFSVVADPQMAMLALLKWLKPGQEQPAALGAPGRVGWHELLAADWEKAWDFYGELFGWQKAVADTSVMGTYQSFSVGGQTIGGMFTKPPTVPVSFWLYYFNIGDIDAAAKHVRAGGGQILNGPIQVPGGSWVVQCTDPQGAIFALMGKRSHNTIRKPEYQTITVLKVPSIPRRTPSRSSRMRYRAPSSAETRPLRACGVKMRVEENERAGQSCSNGSTTCASIRMQRRQRGRRVRGRRRLGVSAPVARTVRASPAEDFPELRVQLPCQPRPNAKALEFWTPSGSTADGSKRPLRGAWPTSSAPSGAPSTMRSRH